MKISRKAMFIVVEQFVRLLLCFATLGEASEEYNTSSQSSIQTGTDAVATIPTATTGDAVSSVAVVDALKTCPSVCICSMSKREIQVNMGIRVICRNRRIDNFTQLISDDLPRSTIYLDLSRNQISELEEGAFLGLNQLEHLDLSYNHLSRISQKIFRGLHLLQQLMLSGNRIKVVPEGTFDALPSLAKLDFQSDVLICDCRMKWISEWIRSTRVRLDNSTVCANPTAMRGQRVKALKAKDLHCGWPLELPLFELDPPSSQVVFEGDLLPLTCRVSAGDDDLVKVGWYRQGSPVMTSETITVTDWYRSGDTVEVQIILEQLSFDHSGVWQCQVESTHGNVSKTIAIVVVPNETIFCPSLLTTTKRGQYEWPKTVAGVTRDLTCQTGPALEYSGLKSARAYHYCDSRGLWVGLAVDQCQFSNNFTRSLVEIIQTLKDNSSHVLLTANRLKILVGKGQKVSDAVDVILISRILQEICKRIQDFDELADIVMGIISTLSGLQTPLLRDAQQQGRACSRLIRTLEAIPQQLIQSRAIIRKMSDRIAFEAFRLDLKSVAPEGVQCSVYRGVTPGGDTDAFTQKVFGCLPGRRREKLEKEAHLEAAIYIPPSAFKSISSSSSTTTTSSSNPRELRQDRKHFVWIQFMIFRDSNLFPVADNKSSVHGTTSVISSQIGGLPHTPNVTNIGVQFMTHGAGDGDSDTKLVHWDFSANDNFGAWVHDGCRSNSIYNNDSKLLSSFTCQQLDYFTILQRLHPTASSATDVSLDSILRTNLIIYVGSATLIICLLIILSAYLFYHKSMKPTTCGHLVKNVCTSMLLLCIVNLLCVQKVEPPIACWLIGLTTHYLSFSTLCWITLVSKKIVGALRCSKEWMKTNESMEQTALGAGSLSSMTLSSSASSLYLVGWGVPAVVAGIGGAIHWNNGHQEFGQERCFHALHLAVVTYFLPAGLMVMLNLFLWLRIARLLLQLTASRKPQEPIKEQHQPREEQAAVLLSGSENNPNTDSSSQYLSANLTTSSSGSSYPPSNASLFRLVGSIGTLQLLCIATCFSGALVASSATDTDIFIYSYAVVGSVFGISGLSVYVKHENQLSGCKCLSSAIIKFFKGRVNDNMKSQSGMTTDCEKQNQEKDLNFALMTPPSVDGPSESSGVCNSSGKLSSYNLRQSELARSFWKKKRQKKTRQGLVVSGCEAGQTTIDRDVQQSVSISNTRHSPTIFSSQTNCSADGASLSGGNHQSQMADRTSTTGTLHSGVSNIHPFQREFPLLNTRILSTFSLDDGLSSTGSLHPPQSNNCSCFHPKYNSLNSSYDGRSTCSARLRDFEDEEESTKCSYEDLHKAPGSIATSPFLDWNLANDDAVQTSLQNSMNSVYLSPRILKHDLEPRSTRKDDVNHDLSSRHLNSPTTPVKLMPAEGGFQREKARHDLCVYCSSDGRIVSRNFFLCGSPTKAHNNSTYTKRRRRRARTPGKSKPMRTPKDVPSDLCEACHNCRCRSTCSDRNSRCDFVHVSNFNRCGVPIIRSHGRCVVSHCIGKTFAQDSDSETNI